MSGKSFLSNSKRLLNSLVGFFFMLGLLGVSPVSAQVSGLEPQERALTPTQAVGTQPKITEASAPLTYQSGGQSLSFQPDGWMMSNGSYALQVTFAGANPVQPLAEAPTPTEQKKTLPGLGKVTYANLWDGISLTYDAPAGSIARSTYSLAPGADVAAIQMIYNAPVTLDGSGNLVTRFDQSQVSESKPIAWQEIAGQRRAVQVAFSLNEVNDQQVGFALGSYDPSQTLYIDPLIGWTTFLGSSSSSTLVKNLSVGSDGSIFIVGTASVGVNWTCSPSPCTRIAQHDTLSSNSDAFVAKLDPTGHLVWNTFLGNADFSTGTQETASDLAFDASGNIYVSGQAGGAWSWVDSSKVKPPTGINNTGVSGYIAKLNSNGDLQWVVPGLGDTSVAVDVNADIYVVGVAGATIFPVASTTQPIREYYPGLNGQNPNAYAAKLDSNGNLKWHTFFGTAWLPNNQNQSSRPADMKLDSKGNLVVLSDWKNTTGGNAGENSLTLNKFTSAGYVSASNTFVSSSVWNGGCGIDASKLILDSTDNIYVTGKCFVTWGGALTKHAFAGTGLNSFVARFDKDMTLLWNTFYSTWAPNGVYVTGIALNKNNLIVGGNSYGALVDTYGTPNVLITSSNTFLSQASGRDGFIMALNVSDGAFVSNTYSHANADLDTAGAAIDKAGLPILSGTMDMTGITPIGTPVGTPPTSGQAAFLAEFGAAYSANLASLAVNSEARLSPAFSNRLLNTSYTVKVYDSATQATLIPTTTDGGTLRYKVGSGPYTVSASGASIEVPFSAGATTTLEIEVVSFDNATTQTYTITIQPMSSNNNLSLLFFYPGDINIIPSFNKATTAYTLGLPYNTTGFAVLANLEDTKSSMTFSLNGGTPTALTSGNRSGDQNLLPGVNSLDVTVTAEDGTVKTYTTTVTRASLSALSLSAGTPLTPAFSADVSSYSLSVPYATASTTVTATRADPSLSLFTSLNSGSETALTSATESGALDLLPGQVNTVDVIVRNTSNELLQTYEVSVTRAAASTNNSLSALVLTVPSTSLTPIFATDSLAYTATVNNAFSTIDVTPTLADPLSSIKSRVNSSLDADYLTQVSAASKTFALNVGANTIDFLVTSQDTTTKTYTVTVTRQAASSIATLSGLTLNHGTLSPAFDIATTSGYTAGSNFSVTSLDITPACSDAYATVQVQNNSGGYTSATCGTLKNIPLTVGDNLIEIIITAQDGTTTQTYSLTFTRAAVSTNNNLSNLTPNSGTLSPAFDPATSAYTLTLNYAVTSIDATPTLADPLSNIQSRVNSGTYADQASAVSKTFALNVGDNPIDFKVSAQDGSIQTYTVTVTRQAASSDNNLSSLTISAGTLAAPYVTNNPTTYHYTSTVPYLTSNTDVTWACSDAYASVRIRLGSGYYDAPCSATQSFTLGYIAPNVNYIYIYVTAQNGSIKNYELDITRAAASTNYNLSNISLSSPITALNPAFATWRDTHSATVNYAFSSIDATPTLTDPLASIQSRVNGGSYAAHTSGTSQTFALNVGLNTIEFLVTAEDTSIPTRTYTVQITRSAASSVTSLTGLALSKGSLNPGFATGTTSYTSYWWYSTSSLDITPTCSDPYATYQVQHNTGGYGSAVACGSPSSIPLIVVYNYIDIKVTAQNGTSTQTYTLRFDRSAPSTDTTLSGITLNTPSTSLSPTFSTSTTSYNATVNYAFTSIDATPALSNWVNSLQSRVNTDEFSPHTNNASKTFALNEGVNTIDILVTAENPSTPTRTYSVTVTRQAASANANLSGLTLNTGTLSPTFDGDTTTYTTGVSSTTTSLNITPACSDSYASPQVQNNAGGYSSVTCGTAKSIPLTIGPNVIEIQVTAQDGSTKTYTITVMRAMLSALSLGAGAFTPAFTGGTSSYTLTLPYASASTTVDATLSDPASTSLYVKLNDGSEIALTSGTASAALDLLPGQANSIDVVVRDSTSALLLQTFSVTVTRTAIANDYNLSGLSLSAPSTALNTAFAAGTTSYTATVNFNFTSIAATPSLASALSNIQSRVNTGSYTAHTSGASRTFALNVGDNPIEFLVTAEDSSTKTYTVSVTRQVAASDDKLTGLTLSAGTLSPAFDPTVLSYSADAPYAVSSLNLTQACSDPYATLQVQNNNGGYTTTTCGALKSIPLSVGLNTIEIKVTAQDGTTTQTTSLAFTREPASSNNNLSGLTLSTGTLTPSFAADENSYTLSLPYANSTISLTGSLADSTAHTTLSLNGGTAVTLTSDVASASQSLLTGDNTLLVTVTAEDGSTKTYTVNVTRAALSDLSVTLGSPGSPGVLTPSFVATTSSYSLTTNESSATVSATRADAATSLSYSLNGATAVALTSGTASAALDLLAGVGNTVDVIIRDSATQALRQTYRVTLIRPAILSAPADNTYYGGQPIDLTVTYGRSVIVNTSSGTPSIALTVGDSTHPDASYQAEYYSGSGSSTLTFRWTVSAFDDNGIAAMDTIELNGGRITDSAGNAILALTTVDTTGIKTLGGLTPTVEISSTSINPSVTGQPYTVNFSVTHAAASPSGTVSVEDGSGATCSGTLSSGLGSCLLTSTSAGSKTLTASYEGDTSFKPASATLSQTVNKASTSTSLSEDPNSTLTGQPYTVTVSVVAVAPGVGIPSGSVVIEDDDGNTCTVAALSAGKGSCNMATYRTGTAYSLQADFSGDENFRSSVNTNNHIVTIADTTTTITSQSPNPSTLGERVTFSAKVEAVAPAGGVPTGTINFREGSLLVCSAALASGLGSCTNTTLSMGDHQIIAVYSGMSNSYTPSSSASVMHRIQQISLDDNKSSTNFTRVGAFSTAAGTAPYTYSLQTSGTVCSSVNGSGNEKFNISAVLLQRNSDTLLGTYAICVQSQDSIGGIVQQGFSIIINAPPVLDADSLDHKSVSTSESLVGRLTSSAGQNPQVLSLESSGPVCNASNSGGNEYFELDGNKLLRKSGTAHGEYAVCVQVKDAEAELAQYSYKITVTQAPTNLDLSRKTTSILQTLVGKFSVEDGQSPFSFSLKSSGKVCNASNGSDNSAFDVNSDQLERLPETGVGVYQVCAQAEDANNGLTQKEFTINVTRTPSDLQLSSLKVSTAQSIVGVLNTLNGQVPFTYSLQNSGLTCNASNAQGNGLFEIDGNALRRLSNTPKGNYALCIQTQDANGELFGKHFEITVTEGNSLPIDWTASLTSNKIIDGDAPGTLVGTVISSLEKASFALADPAIFPQSGHFTLTADGQLKLKISANRKQVPFYSVRIKVTAPTTSEVRYLDQVIQVMKNGVPAGAFAMKDSGDLSASGNVRVDVLANDKLSTGATSWGLLEIVKYPEHGTAKIGSIIYAAAPNFIGTDSVTYRACDNLGYCVLGQVAFSVNAVGSGMPKTGFAANQVTRLPAQPAAAAYTNQSDLALEIPSLKVKAPIVGVPVGDDGWDLTWLGKDAGWLAGSAYPSWDGNSVLTGHLYNADGKPGIFMNVNKLVWGDQLIVHLDGKQYIYEVREILQQVDPGSTGQLMTHKESPWLTLVTCQGYNADNDTYRYRVIVRAVLVTVK